MRFPDTGIPVRNSADIGQDGPYRCDRGIDPNRFADFSHRRTLARRDLDGLQRQLPSQARAKGLCPLNPMPRPAEAALRCQHGEHCAPSSSWSVSARYSCAAHWHSEGMDQRHKNILITHQTPRYIQFLSSEPSQRQAKPANTAPTIGASQNSQSCDNAQSP